MFEVTHCGLDVELLPSPIASLMPDAPGRIRCTCALDLAAAGEPVRCADFILYRLLQVSAATDGAGTPLAFRERLHAVDGLRDMQVNAIEVQFPVPIAPGERRTLRLSYEGPLVGYREVMPYVHDAVLRDIALLRPEILWYPVAGRAGADIVRRAAGTPPFEAVVRGPEGWWAAMAGARREPDAAADPGVMAHFRGVNWSEGFFLVAGRYGERAAGEHFVAHHLPGHEAWAERAAEAARFAAATLTGWLGPRAARGERLDLVEIPEHWGSQSTPGLIMEIYREDPEHLFVEIAHEVSHGWTPGVDPNRFCDEGVAHYLETRLVGARFGEEARRSAVDHQRRWLLAHPEAARIPIAHAAEYPDHRDSVARRKGPLALAVLNACVGDEAMWDLLRGWIRSADAPQAKATAADFCTHVRGWAREHGTLEADRFLQEWFEAPGTPPLGDAEDRAIAEVVGVWAARYGSTERPA